MGNDDARLRLAGIEKVGDGYLETIVSFHYPECSVWERQDCDCDPDIRVEPDDGSPAWYVGRRGERLHDHRH